MAIAQVLQQDFQRFGRSKTTDDMNAPSHRAAQRVLGGGCASAPPVILVERDRIAPVQEEVPVVIPVLRRVSPWDLRTKEGLACRELFECFTASYGARLTDVVRQRYFANKDLAEVVSEQEVCLALAAIAVFVRIEDITAHEMDVFRPTQRLNEIAGIVLEMPAFQREAPLFKVVLDAPNWFTPQDEGDTRLDKCRQEVRGFEFLARRIGYQGSVYCREFYEPQDPSFAAECVGNVFPVQLPGGDAPELYVVRHSIMRRGFHAQVAVSENLEAPVLVSFKGTLFFSGDGSGLRDVPLRPGYDVWELEDSTLPQEIIACLAPFREKSLVLAGHSLGAADAQYAMACVIAAQKDGIVKFTDVTVYAFNPPGVSDTCAIKFVEDIKALNTPIHALDRPRVKIVHVNHHGDLVQAGGSFRLGWRVPCDHAMTCIYKVTTPITAVSTNPVFRHTALHTRLGGQSEIEIRGGEGRLPEEMLSCGGAGFGRAFSIVYQAIMRRLVGEPSSSTQLTRGAVRDERLNPWQGLSADSLDQGDLRAQILAASDVAIIDTYNQMPLGLPRKIFLGVLFLQWTEQRGRIEGLYRSARANMSPLQFLELLHTGYGLFTDPQLAEQKPELQQVFKDIVAAHGRVLSEEPEDDDFVVFGMRALSDPKDFFLSFIGRDFMLAFMAYQEHLEGQPTDPFIESLIALFSGS